MRSEKGILSTFNPNPNSTQNMKTKKNRLFRWQTNSKLWPKKVVILMMIMVTVFICSAKEVHSSFTKSVRPDLQFYLYSSTNAADSKGMVLTVYLPKYPRTYTL